MTSPSIHSVRQWAGNHGPALQGLSAPLLVVAILALMVLPVPPWMLDTFFTLNIAVALMVMRPVPPPGRTTSCSMFSCNAVALAVLRMRACNRLPSAVWQRMSQLAAWFWRW